LAGPPPADKKYGLRGDSIAQTDEKVKVGMAWKGEKFVLPIKKGRRRDFDGLWINQ
jgi:hypothetical protein